MPKKRTIQNLDELAVLAGVSKSTVSRAMAQSPLVSAETRRRIQELARQHGFSVNRNARRLTGRTNIVAIALDFPALEGRRLADPFHFELIADIVGALGVRDIEALLCSPKMDEQRGYQDLIASRGADGIIFVGQGTKETYLRRLARTDVPFVVWGAIQNPAPYCTVGSDNIKGGRLAGERLATLGRNALVFIGTEGSIEFNCRLEGFKQALAEAGRPFGLDIITVSDLSFASASQAISDWFDRLNGRTVDGVFGATDTFAMAFITEAQRRGLSIPQDLSVIGYDDVPFASFSTPKLTTVRQDSSQGGTLLVEKLMQRIEGLKPQSTALPTLLIERES